MDPSTRPGLFVLLVVLAPALLAGVVALAGALVRRGEALGWIGAAAIGPAYVLGHFFALSAPPRFPPGAANEALFWSAGLALFVGVTVGLRKRASAVNALLVALAACGASWFVLKNLVARLSASELSVLFGGIGVGALVASLGAERLASAARGPTAPFCLWGVAAATAVCMALSGAATYASFCAVLAATLGAATVVGWLRRDLHVGRGLAAVFTVQLAPLVAAGAELNELPHLSALLLLIAPALPGLVGESRAQSAGAKRAALMRTALVALPLLVAVGLCVWERSQRVASPYGY